MGSLVPGVCSVWILSLESWEDNIGIELCVDKPFHQLQIDSSSVHARRGIALFPCTATFSLSACYLVVMPAAVSLGDKPWKSLHCSIQLSSVYYREKPTRRTACEVFPTAFEEKRRCFKLFLFGLIDLLTMPASVSQAQIWRSSNKNTLNG